MERENCRTKFLDITKQKRKRKMLLETVSEREREEHTEDRMGREIKKVMERWAHHLGMGYVPVSETGGGGLCVIDSEF